VRAATVAAPWDREGRRAFRTPVDLPDLRTPGPAHDTGHVGLNPFRQHRRSPADIAMVVGALLVCAALVAWAFLA
jgi:hypothetical protein